jgi:glycosyltransferase involved in cell wall biosynthesis
MRFILIGNYPPDKQQSMERFANMLASGFSKEGHEATIWRPVVFFGRLCKSTTTGLGKWMGYLDKWILFPLILHIRLQHKKYYTANIHFHICDHSNSYYLKQLPIDRTVITCHDVLAIRGALGHADAFVGASKTGRILQNWILNNLTNAHKLAAVSWTTFQQLCALDTIHPKDHSKNWMVIYNAFNADFRPLPKEEAGGLLREAGIDPGMPYLLHVGSGLPRKNRKLLIDMLMVLGSRWDGNICFAGEPLEKDLVTYAGTLGLKHRITAVVNPDHSTLVALYNACAAFVFPSLSEGFGWPVIEAQACGAPVIASLLNPLPEVSGGCALHADPVSPTDFADAFISLQNKRTREELIRKGFENAKRFNVSRMTHAYLDLHGFKSTKTLQQNENPFACS